MEDFYSNICPNCFRSDFNYKCIYCGYIELSSASDPFMLLSGVVLKERYIVGRTLGAGGFGITYLALDAKTNSLCAIKEYLPSEIAIRDIQTYNIYPNSSRTSEIFKHGLKVFLNEASLLKEFIGDPLIVQVMDCFEQNNTAYFVMEYLEGVTLRGLTNNFNGHLSYSLAFEILVNVAEALNNIHKKGFLHRDISPENIFITKEAKIKLIDFGATRNFIGDRSKGFTVILKPTFAPPEQYIRHGDQGPWTDIYALAATFYNTLTGIPMIDALDRLNGKDMPDITTISSDIPLNVAKAIEKALRIDYKQRFENVDLFLNALKDTKLGSYGINNNKLNNSKIKNTPYIKKINGDKWIIPQNINMVIGRSPDVCNIIFEFDEISRKHCVVKYDEKRRCFYLIDYSSNGTFLSNRKRLIKNKVYTINAGDEFYLFSEEHRLKVGVE